MCFTEPWTSVRETLDRLKAEAIAEVDAEGLVYVDHPNRFCTAPEDMYKKPVLCAAHVVSIGDPVYRKRREKEKKDIKDEIRAYQEDRRNEQEMLARDMLEHERAKLEYVRARDRRNEQEMLARDMLEYERAKFRADCAARNIRTPEDAERAYIRISVARADVVSLEILGLNATLCNVVSAGGTGRARRQPATYG